MNVRRSLFVILAFVPALLIYQVASAVQETTVTLTFEKNQLLFDQVRGYDRVRLMGGGVISQLGEPVLPAKQILVAIPSGAEATDIHVRSLSSAQIVGSYHMYPGQPPARLDGSPPPAFEEPNPQVYSSHLPYPAQLGNLTGQTDLAGQQMAVVNVHPVQYVPASGQLILHQELELTVQSQPGYATDESYAKFTDKLRAHYERSIQNMVVNPQDVLLNPPMRAASKSLPSGDFDHVVITSPTYAPHFDDLVEWHNKRGLRDTVVTTSYIYSNYSGSDNPEKIRNFVIDAHGTWGTIYFLMGGEDETVPFKYIYYYYEDTPSDQYYADYDDDWTYEVYVGRVTEDHWSQFDTAIDKILKYEKYPPLSDYPLDVLLIGMDLDANTPAEDLKETIDGYIPSRFNVTKVYDSHGTNHKAAARNALNAGQNLVNHADHSNEGILGIGSVNHNGYIDRSDVQDLTNNDRISNLVSMGCWANDMTCTDGIAEHFVIYNPEQAGVSFTGNTRDGWFYSGYPEELSGKMDREWWKSLFNYNKCILGEILADCKNRNLPSGGSLNLKRHCRWTVNLLGEPAMPIWTDTPTSLTATHPETLPADSSSFSVHVESEGSDLENAYVCLWKPGEVYLTDYTDANGDVDFNPSPITPGSLFVTVTKHNYLPYEGNAAVGSGGPPPAVTDLKISLSQSDLVLSWSPSQEKTVVHYVVYRNTLSDFIPASEDSIAGTADTTYTDVGAAAMVGTNHYYVIKAVSDAGQKSDPSNTVGEYDIDLISPPSK
jgi:hypothetical protein